MGLRTLVAAITLCAAVSVVGCARPNAPRAAAPAERQVLSEAAVHPYPEATKVVLYASEHAYTDGKEDRSRVREWKRTLSPELRSKVEAAIVKRRYDRPEEYALACCVPHHELRYYDSRGKSIGTISICFCCSCIHGEPGVPLAQGETLEFKYDELKALFASAGVPVDIGCDD